MKLLPPQRLGQSSDTRQIKIRKQGSPKVAVIVIKLFVCVCVCTYLYINLFSFYCYYYIYSFSPFSPFFHIHTALDWSHICTHKYTTHIHNAYKYKISICSSPTNKTSKSLYQNHNLHLQCLTVIVCMFCYKLYLVFCHCFCSLLYCKVVC